VWKISTQSFRKAHFATFPQKLVEPCLKAGTSAKGCCPECGKPWVRVVDTQRVATRPGNDTKITVPCGWDTQPGSRTSIHREGRSSKPEYREATERHTVGWKAGCESGCERGRQCGPPINMTEFHLQQAVPCTVLDPFAGSGTVGVVCKQMGLDFIGIELNEEYCAMARKRIENPHPEPDVPDMPGQMGLFSMATEGRRDVDR
jgi:hypothetical protein